MNCRKRMITVEGWLKTLNLEQYWPAFEQHGFDILESVSDLSKAVLYTMGITKTGHRLRLLKKNKK
jgi:hypothetical protein